MRAVRAFQEISQKSGAIQERKDAAKERHLVEHRCDMIPRGLLPSSEDPYNSREVGVHGAATENGK